MKTEHQETDEEFIARIAKMFPPKPKVVGNPKPTLPVVSVAQAEALHRQSAERLAERQEEALQAERAAEARRQRFQTALNFWAEQRLFAQQQEERLEGIERYDRDVIWWGYR